MQKYTQYIIKAASAVAASALTVPAAYADVQSGVNDVTPGTVGSDGQVHSSVPTELFGATGLFHTIANIALGLVGAVAVLALIYGGFLYVSSAGDAKRVTAAKDTILYAIIGIVVSILAFAIVAFVTKSLK